MSRIFNMIKNFGYAKSMCVLIVLCVIINFLCVYHKPLSFDDGLIYNKVLSELKAYHNSNIENLEMSDSFYLSLMDTLTSISNKIDEGYIIDQTFRVKYIVSIDSTEWFSIYEINNKFLKEDLGDIILSVKLN